MNTEDREITDLIEEINSLRQQVAQLRDDNQRNIISMERRSVELEALNAIGQATTVKTSSIALYKIINDEIKKAIGEVNFMIALYDAEKNLIEIPYAFEKDDYRQFDPFPLDEGLTSILIRTRQPLMIVDDTANKARELGVIIAGDQAKSWLGVPLMVAGNVIGAIIVQDFEKENRFNEDDQHLLNTLAAQVAVAIRNVSLIEDMRAQADRERLLFEITSKIRRSVDIQAILKTTVTEVGKAMAVRRATIKISVQ